MWSSRVVYLWMRLRTPISKVYLYTTSAFLFWSPLPAPVSSVPMGSPLAHLYWSPLPAPVSWVPMGSPLDLLRYSSRQPSCNIILIYALMFPPILIGVDASIIFIVFLFPAVWGRLTGIMFFFTRTYEHDSNIRTCLEHPTMSRTSRT